MTDFTVRPADARARGERDRAFVFDSWMESWFLAHAAGPLPKDLHNGAYAEMVERILAKPDTRTLVAINPHAPDQSVELAGFLCWGAPAHRHGRGGSMRCGSPVLYYVDVKLHYRGRGVARQLLDAAGLGPGARLCYPCSTTDWKAIAKKYYTRESARFDPLIGRFTLPPPA